MSPAPTSTITKLAYLGFGEAGQAFSKGLGGKMAGISWAFDIKTEDASAAVRDGKWAEYRQAGVTGCVAPEDALTGADVVFSLVTADQAVVAAEGAARFVGDGVYYFDCNSCSPGAKRRAAELVEQAGGRYVDTAVVAPVHPHLHKAPMLISGAHVGGAQAVLDSLEMNAKTVEGPVGAASSIKMVRSVMMKGLEAIFVECVLAGRQAGVDAVVLDSLDATFPDFDFKQKAAYMLERVMKHGVRRAAEMREVAITVDELGLPGRMAGATAEWMQQIGDLAAPAEHEDYALLADELLERLAARKDAA